MANEKMMRLAADTVRLLSADAIQKAKSGHPGMPMGCADFAFDLWFNHMKHNPKNPAWLGRDRFVLSAGHGSMLLYSLLHLFGYGLPMDELKQFRQWDSKTPGHPEFGHTTGVEVTTGPLGTGFASGVGMAVASKYTAAVCGLEGTGLLDNKIYIISGDGCMMEGITHEAASFAGHQKLDNIVVFYDSNMISIEGSTEIAFTEDVAKRFEAYNWRVIKCANANDYAQVDAALTEARKSDGRPTLIIGSTTIGFGAPNKAGKASSQLRIFRLFMAAPSFIQVQAHFGRENFDEFIQGYLVIPVLHMQIARHILPGFGLSQVHAAIPDGLVVCGCYLIADGFELPDPGRIERDAVSLFSSRNVRLGHSFVRGIVDGKPILRIEASLHTSFSDGEQIRVRIGSRRLAFFTDKIKQQVRDFLRMFCVSIAHGIRTDLCRNGSLLVGNRHDRCFDSQRLALPQQIHTEVAFPQDRKRRAPGKSILNLRRIGRIE